MATFVLIHGAWHGAWCWELLTPLLEEEGHCVVAPNLPGMGDDPTPLDQVSIESWARFVADIVGAQPEPVILVGHSRAGIVISRAAELAPANLLGLVYLAAFHGSRPADAGGGHAADPSATGISQFSGNERRPQILDHRARRGGKGLLQQLAAASGGPRPSALGP